MYGIRVVDGVRVEVVFWGWLSTEEALRAVSQAFALAEAGSLDHAICDLRGVDRGPESLPVVRAAVAWRMAPRARVALVVAPRQRRLARWFARQAAERGAIGDFLSMADAGAWLAPNHPKRRLSSTELRHLRELAGRGAPAVGDDSDASRRSGAA